MPRCRNWIVLFSVVIGLASVSLLFIFALENVSGSSFRIQGNRLGLEQERPPRTEENVDLTSSGWYTLHLPMIARNAGSPPPLFGVQMYGRVTYATGLAEVAAAGARWIRVPVSWESAEPSNTTPDKYTWDAIDAQVQALATEGIEPLLTLSGNPSWAAEYPMGPVNNLTDLQEFMGALVERFDGDHINDAPGSPVVRYWEIYNEPDATDEIAARSGGYALFGYNGAGYAELLDAIYPVVKSANPLAKIVFGGVAHDNFDYEGGGFDPDFVDEVLENCTGPCFDVMNFHYYPFYRRRWEPYGVDLIGKANFIRSKLLNHGFDRPLVCTETTWPSASSWGSNVLQSRYVVASYVRGLAAELEVLNWFAWRDIDLSLPGLLDSGLQPKPAYYAFQTLTAKLGGAQFVRSLTEAETGDSNIEGYVFNLPKAAGGGRMDVIWYDCPGYALLPPQDCPSGTSRTMSVSASNVRITDLYGNSFVRFDAADGTVDGKVAIDIGPDPVYIEYEAAVGTIELGTGQVSQASYSRLGELAVSQDYEDHYANCRFGVGAEGDVSQYDITGLNLGWYVDFTARKTPQPPTGVEYIQTMRLQQVGTDGWALVAPAASQLTATVQANPGALWLVGNEPDSPYQDDMMPVAYANAYRDLYYQVKALDPTAQVGIGSIVQPTPLRFAYLDTLWEAYRQAYGEDMPVDVWNIHTYILREADSPPDPEPCEPITKTISVWGAYIPPGITADWGELYCMRDQDNLQVFWSRIRDFRQWMAEHGQREKPLIITEYGVLFPEDYYDEDDNTFSQARVGSYMTRTFELMLNETDPWLGNPHDENRLVQRWAWFSLNSDPTYMGGTLFDPDSKQIRSLGEIFRGYVSAIRPTVDLLAAGVNATPSVFWYEEAPVTATLKAVVSNVGNISTSQPISVSFFYGRPGEAGTSLISEVAVIYDGLNGCADYETLEVEWPGLGPGAHWFYAEVTSADDDKVENNIAEGLVLVAEHRVFLPDLLRRP